MSALEHIFCLRGVNVLNHYSKINLAFEEISFFACRKQGEKCNSIHFEQYNRIKLLNQLEVLR